MPNIDIRLLSNFGLYINWVNALQIFVLFWFLVEFFEEKKKSIFLTIAVFVSILTNIFAVPFLEQILYLAFLTLAVYNKKLGSVTILIGWLSLVILQQINASLLINNSYYYGLAFFNFCIVIAISRKRRYDFNLVNDLKLRSAKLESDLLKKNIQPHFIMNTLLSINSWIEEDPKQAQKLIVALSEEFRIVHQFAERKLVSLDEEIELCKKHLELMGLRKDASYELFLKNLPEEEYIPPMIFHTLIENGLSHSFKSNESGQFEISYHEYDKWKEYSICNDGSLIETFSGNQIEEGLGLRYIKTRLQESFQDKWQLNYGVFNSKWVVNIRVTA